MSDKQVILSKTEFDYMEQRIKDLSAIVESSRITSKTTRIPGSMYSYNTTITEYYSGFDSDQEAIKDIKDEIETIRKERDGYATTCLKRGEIITDLQDQINELKNKPWYKFWL